MTKESISSYKDLKVWMKAIDLTELIYKQTQSFPDEEKFGLVSQMRRSVVSVASNIAEGWGRGRTGEYITFLRYARASLAEIETQAILSQRLGYLSENQLSDILQLIEIEGKMLLALIRSLESHPQHG